ncbi:hypothetical protein LOTGIDRAFT_152683 [Lottia gigantea]|uniref:CARD domain-containing protein n=1 Tax=Lottia gigantea TaxID=225164 RepID=V4C7C9_LOTGI|nr:hypothetical protein LOTGIDRAFT_152683 [Lottia gigantea]ESO97594.1 hypothetical protein LOTGIDRAFT_152683 [Lottia gigantea]
MEQGSTANSYVTNREREYLAKLCWLLHDAGTYTLRTIFNSIHPGITLKEHLAQHHIRSVLVKLHEQKALSESQWRVLYPVEKGGASSQRFDSRILVILLQTICHLSPPYPNGWSAEPLPNDTSLSADVVRLQILLQQIGSLVGVRHEEYPVLWRKIVEVLLRQGGPAVRGKIERTDTGNLNPEQQNFYIQHVKDIWGTTESGVGALRHLNGPRALNKPSKGGRKKTEDQEGLSLEDKVVLSKMFKVLMDTAVAEDIIDRLQQGQIIKITDRQEITALSKNSERMQFILLKIQNSKSPYAFKIFLDALKFKYNKLYEEVSEFRRITYKHGVKETRVFMKWFSDLVGICNKALKAHYGAVFSKMSPLPWNENLQMPIKDYFTATEIVHSDGHKVQLHDILPPRVTTGRGSKVILEGESGSGKSTLAAMMTYQWATKPDFFSEYYRFMILVDAELLEGNVRKSIYQQTILESSKITFDEFWETLESYDEDVVLVIDGFTGGRSELCKLIDGTHLLKSAVLVMVSPNISMSKVVKPDYKLFNVGLSVSHIPRCLRIYAGMMRIGSDDFDILLEELESWPHVHNLRHPFICYVTITTYKYTKLDLSKFVNISSLFESYVKSLATQFSKKHRFHLQEDDEDAFQSEVGDLVHHIEKLCFSIETTKKTFFTDGEIMGTSINTNVMKFGVLQRSPTTGLIKGHCSVLNNHMSARHLADLPPEELQETLDQRHILKYTKYSDIVSFLCGLYYLGERLSDVEKIFTGLTEIKTTRRLNGGSVHLVHLNQSLQSIVECQGNAKNVQTVATSFPKALSLHKRGIYPVNAILGLASVLKNGIVHLVQFDMYMHHYYLYQENIYMELATALSKCSTLKIIKATWARPEMMAKFLAKMTQNKPSLDFVQVDALKRSTCEELSAVTWDDLQSFCENLQNCQSFSFIGCQFPQIVGHVIKCLPYTISAIDFSKSELNLICASQLASHLEHSRCLKNLNLSNTELMGSSIVALAHGLKLSGSIEELRLCGIEFDRSGIAALGEALRLVTTLKALDLNDCTLTSEMCSLLAPAFADNQSLNVLRVSSARIASPDLSLIKSQQNDNFSVVFTDDQIMV